jgi:hypothetical protein
MQQGLPTSATADSLNVPRAPGIHRSRLFGRSQVLLRAAWIVFALGLVVVSIDSIPVQTASQRIQ